MLWILKKAIKASLYNSVISIKWQMHDATHLKRVN